jgi:exodeoxyribonuclease V alpha subunit
LPGIGRKRLAAVTRAWEEQKSIREIMVFLQSHKVGPARAVRIYKTYGDDAVRVITENPYRLSGEIHGIGFLTADAIAGSLGIPKMSPLRAEAGVVHVLQEFVGQGHCCVPLRALMERCVELLETPEEIVREAIDEGVRRTVLFREDLTGELCIWLTSLRDAELEIAARLLRLREGSAPWQPIDGNKALPWVEEKTGTILASSQKEAAAGALRHKVMVITGGPGVGKTTLVNSVLRIVAAKKGRILLCAPTGRAAKRLSESTGMEARTIHRLLEFDPVTGGFKRGTLRPLNADLVVLDEASMVDVVLMSQFLAALPDSTALLMVGDIDQIPSVGPGSVLRDIIASGAVPVATLTEIFRQAEASEIVLNAHRVNRGELPRGGEKEFFYIPADSPEEILKALLHVALERIPRRFGLDPAKDVQVLTPMNRGVLGARSLNLELQQRMNPTRAGGVQKFGSTFSPGDKVIQTVNDYDKEVFNGDIGHIRTVDAAAGRVEIDYEGRTVSYDTGELDTIALAYAITIHKSQGSEYPAVVMPVSTQHYVMLQRNLLYTGLTRGKSLVVLIGQPRALATATGNTNTVERLTALRQRLM